MMLLGMGIAITVPYFVLFATNELGMSTNQFGVLLALAAVSQFTVNAIVARFSDTHHLNRKILIICALFMGALSFLYILHPSYMAIYYSICDISRIIRTCNAPIYASARESINASSSRNNAKFANTVLRSMFSFGFYLVHSLVHISFNLWATQGCWRHSYHFIIYTVVTNILL